jgi:hypothetical protein
MLFRPDTSTGCVPLNAIFNPALKFPAAAIARENGNGK